MSAVPVQSDGFKHTEAGVIPADWWTTTLGEVSTMSSGTTPPRKMTERYFKNGTINWVKTLDLNDSEILATDEQVTRTALEETSLRTYPVGTVLIAMYGGFNQIGRTGLLRVPAAVNQAITAIQPQGARLCPEFLLATLNFKPEYWKSVASSSRKDPNITSQDVRAFPLALPGVEEQRAVARALSDLDALLAKLDELLTKKLDIKHATMQQLLTGVTRLAGYSEKWEDVRLGDLFAFKNGLNKAKEFFGFGTPIVNYMDVYSNTSIVCSKLHGRVSLSAEEIKNFDVKKGDVLFTRTSETAEEIGMAAVVLDEPAQTVFSGFVLRARPRNNRLCDRYKAYCFGSSSVRRQIIGKASYTTRALTNGRHLSEVQISLPSRNEQAAIADVLFGMDAELAALEARRDKTRALKQGMMQQLLTGRIRLI